MSRTKRYVAVACGVIGVVAGAIAAYTLMTDSELRQRIFRNAKDAYDVSKQRVNDVTEEVAIKTAQVTKNPKVNQDWVQRQWESLGY